MHLTAQRIERLAHEPAARSDRDVTAAIKRHDPETRIAVRQAIQMQREAHGIQAKGAVPEGRRLGEQDGSYWLRHLNVHGPIDLKTLEAKMSVAGLEPSVRIEIKCEAIEWKWLAPSVGYRVTAAGELATDQEGRPLGRLASDDATVDYRPGLLSLEMARLVSSSRPVGKWLLFSGRSGRAPEELRFDGHAADGHPSFSGDASATTGVRGQCVERAASSASPAATRETLTACRACQCRY